MRALDLPPVGTKVIRPVVMEDGTWERKGDKCLKDSPLITGWVQNLYSKRSEHFGWWDTVVVVRWNNGSVKEYLPHGVDMEDTP